MIEFLTLESQSSWMPQLEKILEDNVNILDMSPEMIKARIFKSELFVFRINKELLSIAAIFPYGAHRIFLIYFLSGKNLLKNIEECLGYIKNSCGCDGIEFYFTGTGREKLYERVFRHYKKQYKVYCKIML